MKEMIKDFFKFYFLMIFTILLGFLILSPTIFLADFASQYGADWVLLIMILLSPFNLVVILVILEKVVNEVFK